MDSNTEVQRNIYKIIVIGDSDVGKTCLTFRFCTGKFPDKTEATIGVDFRERIMQIDNCEVKLQLWDTAGQERFRKSMIPHYYRNAHAIVFVYDVTNAQSFTNLSFWIDECERYSANFHSIPRVMVGNKCDINNPQVDTNAAQRFADSHSMPLFETSAKSNTDCDNVEAIFLTLAHKLKSCKELMGPTYPSIQKATVLSIDKELHRSSGTTECMC